MNGTGEAKGNHMADAQTTLPGNSMKQEDDLLPFVQRSAQDMDLLQVVNVNDAQLPLPNGIQTESFRLFDKQPASANPVGPDNYLPGSEKQNSETVAMPLDLYGTEPMDTGLLLDAQQVTIQNSSCVGLDSTFDTSNHFTTTTVSSGDISFSPFAGIPVLSTSGNGFQFESMLPPSGDCYDDTSSTGHFDLPVLDDVEFSLTADDTTAYRLKDQRRRHPTAPGSLLAASRPGSSLTQDFLNVFSLPPPPVARAARKSRGKPDSIFTLLKKNGMTDSTKWSRARSCSLRHVDQATFKSRHAGMMSPLGKSKSDEAVQKTGLTIRRNSTRSRSKPLPLIIPPYVFFNRFQSQLRSPSLSENHAVSIIGVHARTPYTPPPILSPLRRGSGLFCRIRRPSPIAPKSAPICCSRQEFWNNVDLDNPLLTATSQSDDVSPAIQSPPDSPVKTDSLPHINVGTEYQAIIPTCLGLAAVNDVTKEQPMASLLFDPACLERVDRESMQDYMLLANSPAVHMGGTNTEMALHLLCDCGGDIALAAGRLVGTEPLFSAHHPFYDYAYNDCVDWTPKEVGVFEEALLKSDKDFNEIAAAVRTKTVSECVSFYYTWKTVFRRNYQAYRIAKQRKEYLQFTSVMASSSPVLEESHSQVEEQKLETLSTHTSLTAIGRSSAIPFYPCNICGKVFCKVKSRNAHMKVHYKD